MFKHEANTSVVFTCRQCHEEDQSSIKMHLEQRGNHTLNNPYRRKTGGKMTTPSMLFQFIVLQTWKLISLTSLLPKWSHYPRDSRAPNRFLFISVNESALCGTPFLITDILLKDYIVLFNNLHVTYPRHQCTPIGCYDIRTFTLFDKLLDCFNCIHMND